ncbi:hypothetical protein HF086_006276 [Spodoptera exigua]|uniref:Uncharacterized protein n=1 Tax=Spodoptera exigua TaxID=7107 RepID=A0A922S8Y5_SPOEX|nr:hypothetical protein HF086_006276 [Spodoptera exigua]
MDFYKLLRVPTAPDSKASDNNEYNYENTKRIININKPFTIGRCDQLITCSFLFGSPQSTAHVKSNIPATTLSRVIIAITIPRVNSIASSNFDIVTATNDSTGSNGGAGGEPPSAAASPDAAALVVLQPPAPPYPPYAHYDGTTTLASEYAYAAPYSQYSPYGGPYSHSAATGLLSKCTQWGYASTFVTIPVFVPKGSDKGHGGVPKG